MKINKKCIKNIIGKIGLVITVLLAILIVYLASSQIKGKVPFIFNKAVLNVVTGSMEPVIPTGSYIVIKKVSPDDIKIDDVITFYSRDPLIYGLPNTHKVVEIIGEGDSLQFKTQGVNEVTNTTPDKILVNRVDVVGVYQKNLPLLTKFADFMRQKAIFFLLIIVPALSIVTIQVKEVIIKAKEIKIEELIKIEVERLKNEQNEKL